MKENAIIRIINFNALAPNILLLGHIRSPLPYYMKKNKIGLMV